LLLRSIIRGELDLLGGMELVRVGISTDSYVSDVRMFRDCGAMFIIGDGTRVGVGVMLPVEALGDNEIEGKVFSLDGRIFNGGSIGRVKDDEVSCEDLLLALRDSSISISCTFVITGGSKSISNVV
jgi:hypothetical protein